MKTNKYLFFLIGLLLNQATLADTFSDTFQGPVKLNLNLYVFTADVDGISKRVK